MKKTTIYIDIDDDIAAIIEKLETAEQKIVAMVLPKRPSVMQSSVNLQLLKKSAEDTSRNLVLITNDDQVMRLAGEAGLHVSSSLQSKPYIPVSSEQLDADEPILVDAGGAESTNPAQPDVYSDDKKVDLSTPIGDLVDEEEIVLPEEEVGGEDKTEPEVLAKSKKIKVPNFGKFRTKVIASGTLLIALIVFFIWATMFAPTAKITIKTEKSDLEAKLSLVASTATTTVNAEKGEVSAVKKEDKQKLSGTFAATGQKDAGEKASGTVTLRNCESTDPLTIPSGTGVSKGSYTFITQSAVNLEGGNFSGGGTVCTTPSSEEVDVAVVASQSGDQYNVAAGTYTVAGFTSVRASGTAMGGGTTKLVKVVSQEDIDAAKAKVLETAADNVKGKLSKLLSDEGLIAIDDTFSTSEGAPQSSIAVGQEASADPTLSVEVTSTMLGMKQSEVEPLLEAELNKKIDTAKQKVYQSGASGARISVAEKPNAETVKIVMIATASIGPNLDIGAISSEIAGKKAGEAKQLLEARPGVAEVGIDLNPFWVFSVPKKTSKINIIINE